MPLRLIPALPYPLLQACRSWRRALSCLVFGALGLTRAEALAAPAIEDPGTSSEAEPDGPSEEEAARVEDPERRDEVIEGEALERGEAGAQDEPTETETEDTSPARGSASVAAEEASVAAEEASVDGEEASVDGEEASVDDAKAEDEATEASEPTAAEESRWKALFDRLRPKVRIPVRLNTTVQGEPRNRLDGFRFDTVFTLPRFSGKITDLIGWQLGFFGRAQDFSQAELRVLDVIAELNILPQLHLWGGRFVVPADRSNLSGPFFVPVWNYPGFYGNVYTIGPVAGAVGRDVGAMVWGEVGEGRFKYFAAVQALEDPSVSPRMTGRMNVTILGREPGFYNAGSYLGTRDVVALGGSLQYQPAGERAPEDPLDPESLQVTQGDLWVADVDLIAEKNFGRAGTPTLEATYYAFDRFRPYRHAFFVSAAYLMPWEIGPGKIQPGVRWQQAFPGATPGGGLAGLDASAAYLFAGYRARFVVVYQHQRLGDGGPASNAFNIGFQYIVM